MEEKKAKKNIKDELIKEREEIKDYLKEDIETGKKGGSSHFFGRNIRRNVFLKKGCGNSRADYRYIGKWGSYYRY